MDGIVGNFSVPWRSGPMTWTTIPTTLSIFFSSSRPPGFESNSTAEVTLLQPCSSTSPAPRTQFENLSAGFQFPFAGGEMPTPKGTPFCLKPR